MSMNISPSDMANLQSLFGAAGQYNWSDLLGQVTLGTPANGTATGAQLNSSGYAFGPQGVTGPTLAADQSLGAIMGQPTVNYSEMTGNLPDSYTTPWGSMTGAQILSMDPQQANAFIDWVDQLKGQPITSSPGSAFQPGGKDMVGTQITGDSLRQTLQEMLGELNSVPGIKTAGGATLANQENYAQQFGRAGSYGAGATPGGPLTLGAQNQYTNAILNAAKGPADAFSYLAKQQSMGNQFNPVAQLLGSNIQGATGQTLQSLASMPTLTNTQLAGDLVNSQNGGSISPLTQQFLARSLQLPAGQTPSGPGTTGMTVAGTPPAAGPQSVDTPGGKVNEAATGPVNWTANQRIFTDQNGYGFVEVPTAAGANWVATGQRSGFAPSSFNVAGTAGSAQGGFAAASGVASPGAGSGAVPQATNPADGGTTVYGGTHFHLPTGFQTNLQDWNKLEPETQGAYMDLQQASGGQTPGDFLSGLKQGSPEFGKTAAGSMAPSAL